MALTAWRRLLPALLLPGASACAEEAPPPAPAPRPPIVVIVIDTARFDHFSGYGYDRPTTPVFESFARGSVLFANAWSTSCWTVPAHASLFTGQYAAAHGATQETQYLADEAVTLAEALAAEGYQTASFSGNPWISPKANLVQGFGTAKVIGGGKGAPRGTGLPHALNRAALEWLDARDPERPFLLFINYIEPHWKYQAPAVRQKRFVPGGRALLQSDPAMFAMPRWYLRRETVPIDLLPVRTAMYDAEISFADAILGELLRGLGERGILEGSLVAITSDHGENHGDHGHVAHAFSLNETLVRVPLAVRRPGGEGAGTIRTDPVQLLDLFPTLARAGGAEAAAAAAAGRDLLRSPAPPDRPVVTEYYYPRQVLDFLGEGSESQPALQPFLRRLRSVRIGSDKLIQGSDGRDELFDLAADPGETRNLVEADPARVAALEDTLLAILGPLDAAPPVAADTGPVDPEIEEQLRALGYVR